MVTDAETTFLLAIFTQKLESLKWFILASHRKILHEHTALPSPADHAFAFLGSMASRNGASISRTIVLLI